MTATPEPTQEPPPAPSCVPGPDGFTEAELALVYEGLTADDAEPSEGQRLVAHAGERDLAWWAWCAEQVDSGAVLDDPDAIRAAASLHHRHQAAAALAGLLERFAVWRDAADETTRSAVLVALEEHRSRRVADAHLGLVRARQVGVGAAQGQQLRSLAALSMIYAGALPTGAAVDQHDTAAMTTLGVVDDLERLLAPALGWSDHVTGRRVRLAPRVVSLLPHTLLALEAGHVDLERVLRVAERTGEAAPEVTREVDAALFGPGGSGFGLGTTELVTETDRVIATVDADALRARTRARTRGRTTTVRPLADGQAELRLTGPAPAVYGAARRLGAVARANRAEALEAASAGRVAADGGDPYAEPDPRALPSADAPGALLPDRRTLANHRFDALVAALTTARPATGAALTAVTLELQVALPAALPDAVFAHLDGGRSAVDGADDPAWLAGYGYLHPWLARVCLSGSRPGVDCVLRRVLFDPFTGDLVTVDGHTYAASALAHPHGPDGPGGPDGPPPPPPPGGGGRPPTPPPDPSPGSGSFRGRPVQQLPAPRTEDDVLEPPLTEEQLARVEAAVAQGLDPWADPCEQATCTPVDPATCPVSGVGGGRYLPGADLARWVRARWGTCTGPGSTVAASQADLDHVVPHRGETSRCTGGPTCACNLEPKSPGWHRVKHATDRTTWTNPRDPGGPDVPWTRRWRQWRCTRGASHWTSPLGQQYHRRPRRVAEPLGPFRRLRPARRARTLDLVPGEGLAAGAAPGADLAVAPVTFPVEPPF